MALKRKGIWGQTFTDMRGNGRFLQSGKDEEGASSYRAEHQQSPSKMQ